MKKRALISVSDKTGVIEFAKELTTLGYEIISTGGTAKALSDAGIKIIAIDDVTGFPEALDGRVKTMHPRIHAGLLAMRSNHEHMKFLSDMDINTIDIVAVNLYPFKATIQKENVEFGDAVENIDIGGPTMLRSAAKNYQDVLVLCDPTDYTTCIDKLKAGNVDLEYKKLLMYKVFQHTAVYDTLISQFLREKLSIRYPDQITFAYEKKQGMRYGENPHQDAAFYVDAIEKKISLANAKQLGGKELSLLNINDAAGALDLLNEFDSPAAVAVKHATPCGVALGEDAYTAYMRTFECDPLSIYGGVVALNRKVDARTASEMVKIYLEIVIAPAFDPEAVEILKTKPNLRILELAGLEKPISFKKAYDIKNVYGGMLLQDKDADVLNKADIKIVTKAKPTQEQMEQMEFAYKVVKHVKSNGIAVIKDFAAVGLGGGQTSRTWAAEQAIAHAGERAKGAVLASDAYIPFNDTTLAAAKAGIIAIIQPGGSIRDEDSIKACDENGMSMVFTNMRHFKH